MVINLIVERTDDGFVATIPGEINQETWAHTEEEVIEKSIDIVRYFLKIEDSKKINIDKARGDSIKTIYKIIIK